MLLKLKPVSQNLVTWSHLTARELKTTVTYGSRGKKGNYPNEHPEATKSHHPELASLITVPGTTLWVLQKWLSGQITAFSLLGKSLFLHTPEIERKMDIDWVKEYGSAAFSLGGWKLLEAETGTKAGNAGYPVLRERLWEAETLRSFFKRHQLHSLCRYRQQFHCLIKNYQNPSLAYISTYIFHF